LNDIKISEKIGVNSWNIDETTILTNVSARTAELCIEKACKKLQKMEIYISGDGFRWKGLMKNNVCRCICG